MSSSLTKHAHILFNGEDYKYLKKLAQSQRKTLGELIRSAVRKVYGSRELGERLQAGERLLKKSDLDVSDWNRMEEDAMGRYG